ncbi:phospholipase D-like domain-containing protein [Pararhizobium sp. BT-229]|uniref:phospholipase D-like domain-containing protein n=1 Tax=Pararhizobium sp. BT-229 TaxID=2986923 RepID=UPI0021F6AE93|nr:phospholipase D-like domain-containing protein [Pararhizobium sp. BT-229]MCV9965279.1 phospholipase D-like domain-containing protein [Pararhizobium sp. BT-229]
MIVMLTTYWPHILAVLSVALGVPAAIHAAMTKDEVRSALGWVGIILLSPVLGALLYAIAGINRIRRSSIEQQRSQFRERGPDAMGQFDVSAAVISDRFGQRFGAMKMLGDRVSRHRMCTGNSITLLEGGDAAYAAMLQEIASASRAILLETYIFDRDDIGLRFADALIAAVKRGVAVRVLIDAVGARYSVPSIVGHLEDGGVTVKVFNGNIIMGLRLPYANLRTHRKILIVDGAVAFTGGMNIRSGFTSEFAGDARARDTHFRVSGPVVADLFQVASEDWQFSSREPLRDEAWRISPVAQQKPAMLMRAVPSGPDRANESNHKMMMGAFSIARRNIRIMSPYFLPDRELIGALVTAAMRGVEVDIIVPAVNNLLLVDRAMTAQFDQTLKGGCRIWRATGAFNHSKLMTVDDRWAYVGSSNLDPRSLRLNFEIDLEVLDAGFASAVGQRIQATMKQAWPVTLADLRAKPFATRLINKIFWLGSPYL